MRRVIVAVPARDEADAIGACLRSIDVAAGHGGFLDVEVAIAADRCRDATAEIVRSFAARHCRVTLVAGRWRTVGAARAAAVAAVLARRRGAAETWIANTDADCRVPGDWLTRQVATADAGWGAVAGTVRLDPVTAPADLAADFERHYRARNRHVHAANFGLHATAYGRVGGWSPTSVVGEEHHLWRRLGRSGVTVTHDPELCVITSHRLHGRVRGGFATVLSRLAAEPTSAVPVP